jgi:hypothetical protein
VKTTMYPIENCEITRINCRLRSLLSHRAERAKNEVRRIRSATVICNPIVIDLTRSRPTGVCQGWHFLPTSWPNSDCHSPYITLCFICSMCNHKTKMFVYMFVHVCVHVSNRVLAYVYERVFLYICECSHFCSPHKFFYKFFF